MDQQVTTYYLEMLAPENLRAKACPDPGFRIAECRLKRFECNRFLYQIVGSPWRWMDKNVWTDSDWKEYAEAGNLRTWLGYIDGSPVGYYELQKQEDDKVEIASFGLTKAVIGQGLGGYLLSHAITSAWEWGALRVWVHTCSLDHANALANYRARGMKVYKTETANKTLR